MCFSFVKSRYSPFGLCCSLVEEYLDTFWYKTHLGHTTPLLMAFMGEDLISDSWWIFYTILVTFITLQQTRTKIVTDIFVTRFFFFSFFWSYDFSASWRRNRIVKSCASGFENYKRHLPPTDLGTLRAESLST